MRQKRDELTHVFLFDNDEAHSTWVVHRDAHIFNTLSDEFDNNTNVYTYIGFIVVFNGMEYFDRFFSDLTLALDKQKLVADYIGFVESELQSLNNQEDTLA